VSTFCPHCGTQLTNPQAQFCPVCGYGLPAPPAGHTSRPGTQHIQLAQLIIQWPGGRAQPVPLLKDTLSLGRDQGNDVVVNFGTVSRQHAYLERRNGVFHVVDLGSRNGTTLNGQRLMPNAAYPLMHGAVLRIGDMAGNSVSLTFEDGSASVGPAIVRQLNLQALPTATLGRDPRCDVPLPGPTVSWHHARIDQTAGGIMLRDLGSTNGTFVNGQRVTMHPLHPGDRIQIGPFQLVYQPSGLAQLGGTLDFCLDAIRLCRAVPDREKRGATKVILNDVCLSIQPREFLALVGGSGAGKSTLMNALNGFKRADQGQVLVNGDDLYQHFGLFRTQLGYVPQDDIVHLGLPVGHALRYAARLRLPPDTSGQEITKRIDDVLTRVGMMEQKRQVVSSLSGGQRKRVNIGTELLAEPGLFFLDEPTSGLDPGLEKRMMDTLRHLADEGRTIILVTHATANITLCDLVAFMAHGRLVFYGPPDEAKRFFGVSEFADIYTQLEPPPTPQDPSPDLQKVAEHWNALFMSDTCYQQYVANRQAGTHARSTPGQVLSPANAQGPARPLPLAQLRQFMILAQRYLELILHDRMGLGILLAVMPFIGFLLLLIGRSTDLVGDTPDEIARQMASSSGYHVAGSTQTLLLMMSLAAVLLGLFGSAYEIVKEWSIYRRERMVNLGIAPYLASKIIVLMGFALVQCFALLAVLSLKIELPEEGVMLPAPVEMYVTLLLGALVSVALGLFISALARSQNMVIYIILVVLFIQIIFAGVLFDLPSVTTPLSYLTVTRWTMESLGATVNINHLKDLGVTEMPFPADPTTGLPAHKHKVPDGWKFKINYDRTEAHLLSRWAILLAFAGLWIGLAGIVLRRRDEI
jgi:ABC-type multidrug transport system ATPase subunit/pSer/pThr/pTyr-binding forkhead associated (FHA) protein